MTRNRKIYFLKSSEIGNKTELTKYLTNKASHYSYQKVTMSAGYFWKLVSLLMVMERNGSDRCAWVRADSSWATDRMVGLDSGLARVQASAIFTVTTTFTANCPVGGGWRWSNTSFKNRSSSLDNDEDDDCKLVIRSPGCLPIITSKATTPQL